MIMTNTCIIVINEIDTQKIGHMFTQSTDKQKQLIHTKKKFAEGSVTVNSKIQFTKKHMYINN